MELFSFVMATLDGKRVNLSKEEAGVCFDNMSAYRKQTFLELPLLGDSKELLASSHGDLQSRKPMEDKQVETL